MASLRNTWRYHRAALRGWWGASRWNRLLVLLILVYGVVFSVLTCLRILALSAFAWDLGIYNQAMYTTVAFGRFFYVSGLPGSPASSLFGGHFSPILFLLLPIYALLPSPFTLVVIQTWAIALAAAPIYRLAQKLLGNELFAFGFALVFLLDPATEGVNWFDFHAEAFLLLTLSCMLYFYERRNWKWFLVFAILSLSTIEMASILVALVAVGALAADAWRWLVAHEALDLRRTAIFSSVVIFSAAWDVLAGVFVAMINPASGYFSAPLGSWGILGASTLSSVPAQVLLHPDRALAALAFDGEMKAWYLIVLFAPVQFLTLRSPRAVLFCLPWLVVSLSSNWAPYYLLGNQFPSFILPFLFYGAVVGLARPWSFRRSLRGLLRRPAYVPSAPPHPERYVRALVGVTLVLLVVVSPMGPWALGSDTTGRLPIPGTHTSAVLSLYNLVPANASVLTQNNLYPLLSSRMNVHFVPASFVFPPWTSFNATMNNWTSTVDYILVDCLSGYVEAFLLLAWPGVSGHYSVVAAKDGAILLERGSHPLSQFQPITRTFGYNAVVPENATFVVDPPAGGGTALLHADISTSHFWYGPFLLLPPGGYTVTYRLKTDRSSSGPLIWLPVILHPMQLDARVITYSSGWSEVSVEPVQLVSQVFVNVTRVSGLDIPSIGAYFTVSTNFTATGLGVYEFPGLGASGAAQLWFDQLTVAQVTAAGSGTIPIEWS